jgi:A/G-specific adenine glycosylase
MSGLLAGLFEPPTTPSAEVGLDTDDQKELALSTLSSIIGAIDKDITTTHQRVSSIPHIFSHINMTYHIQLLVLNSTELPPLCRTDRAVWLSQEEVESANIGTGVKKVWAEIYGSWGSSEPVKSGSTALKGKRPKKGAAPSVEGKVVKKVMMPSMPRSTVAPLAP